MKATQSPANGRTILVRDINDTVNGSHVLSELDVTIGYTGQGNSSKGVVLDSIVIPRILTALNGEGAEESTEQPVEQPAEDGDQHNCLMLRMDLQFEYQALIGNYRAAAIACEVARNHFQRCNGSKAPSLMAGREAAFKKMHENEALFKKADEAIYSWLLEHLPTRVARTRPAFSQPQAG